FHTVLFLLLYSGRALSLAGGAPAAAVGGADQHRVAGCERDAAGEGVVLARAVAAQHREPVGAAGLAAGGAPDRLAGAAVAGRQHRRRAQAVAQLEPPAAAVQAPARRALAQPLVADLEAVARLADLDRAV